MPLEISQKVSLSLQNATFDPTRLRFAVTSKLVLRAQTIEVMAAPLAKVGPPKSCIIPLQGYFSEISSK